MTLMFKIKKAEMVNTIFVFFVLSDFLLCSNSIVSMIKLENRNRVKIVKIRWCMMRKLVDAIYLENIDDVRTILENEPGL